MFIKSKVLFMTIIILISISIGLGIIHTINGPVMVKSTVYGDSARTVVNARFNNNIDNSSKIETVITPSIDNSYEISGDYITITFNEPTRSNTSYQIIINGIKDTRGKQSTAKLHFTTPSQSFAYIQRESDTSDKIYYKKNVNDKENLLYESELINQFALNSKMQLLVLSQSSNNNNFTYLNFKDKNNISTLSPPKGSPVEIVGSAKKEYFLIKSRDYNDYRSYVYMYKPSDNSFKEITYDNGDPIIASNMSFASDGETIIFQDSKDGIVYLYDTKNSRPSLNLGVAMKILRYLENGDGVFIESQPNEYRLLKSDGTDQAYDQKVKGTMVFLNALNKQNSFIGIRSVYSSTESASQVLFTENAAGNKDLVEYDLSKVLINDMRVSKNDEFIAIEKANLPVIYDSRVNKSSPKNSELYIYNTEGQVIYNTTGTGLIWL